jgi:hypothetical protein
MTKIALCVISSPHRASARAKEGPTEEGLVSTREGIWRVPGTSVRPVDMRGMRTDHSKVRDRKGAQSMTESQNTSWLLSVHEIEK